MLRRTVAAAAAFVVALAAVAVAFEFTSWHGNLTCSLKMKIVEVGKTEGSENLSDSDLNTDATTFTLNNVTAGSLPGTMERKNDRNYKVSSPTGESAQTAFLQWVAKKIKDATGTDVNLVSADLKGKFKLNKEFNSVNVKHTITFSGTVSGGENSGKSVSGKITIAGDLPRVFN